MKVEDAMTRTVVSVHEQTPFKDVAETLIDHEISAVPVVDDAGNVSGLVTEADLIAKEAYPGYPKRGVRAFLADVVAGRNFEWVYKAQATKAWEVMTPDVISVEPRDDLHTASRKMLEEDVKRLVVLDQGRLVGILSRSDILRVLAASDEDLRDRIERSLTRWGFVPPDATIAAKVSKGVVTLEGSVVYESDIRIVGSMVETIDGVVALENLLLYRYADPKLRDIKATG